VIEAPVPIAPARVGPVSPLGFGIPAYRRPENLDVALASVVPQARLINAPIYIPDDSCDATNAAVVHKWRSTYPAIIHEINAANLGIDRNIDKAICGCPADYVHVMGEDDVILGGFVESAMRAIADGAPGHLLCSYVYLSNEYEPLSNVPLIPSLPAPVSLRSVLPHHGWALGFIGAHIFRRDRYLACTADGFGTYFNHLVRIVEYLDPDERLGHVAKPVVGNRADDESTPTWSSHRLDVVFGIESVFASAMRGRYEPREIWQTVSSCRRRLGYAQFVRLLYWAALADRSGGLLHFWDRLAFRVSRPRYLMLRAVPKLAYGPVLALIPKVRRAKRYARRLIHGAKATSTAGSGRRR
jgi:glycosyltransferase involved in cell wall biosynthesis